MTGKVSVFFSTAVIEFPSSNCDIVGESNDVLPKTALKIVKHCLGCAIHGCAVLVGEEPDVGLAPQKVHELPNAL